MRRGFGDRSALRRKTVIEEHRAKAVVCRVGGKYDGMGYMLAIHLIREALSLYVLRIIKESTD